MNNKNQDIKKAAKFMVCFILSVLIIFPLISLIYTGELFPPVFVRDRASQRFGQDELFLSTSAITVENGVMTSTTNDPWVSLRLDPGMDAHLVTIRISGLSAASTPAQLFFVREGESLSEVNSIWFPLTNGLNLIRLPGYGYSFLRFDPTVMPDVSMVIDEFTVSNYFELWGIHWAIMIALIFLIAFIWYMVFFSPLFLSKLNGFAVNKIVGPDKITDEQILQTGFFDMFKHGKVYWICVIITGVLCYGFTLTNFSMGVDEELMLINYDALIGVTTGRWGSRVFRYVFQYIIFLPFWADFIALTLIISSLTFFCGLLKKYSKGRFDDKAAAIFACVAISFPWIADIFIFMVANIGTGISRSLSVISLFFASKWIIEKKRFVYFIPSALLMGYALAFSEAAAVFFLTTSFFLLFLHYIFSDKKDGVKQFAVAFAKIIVIMIGALLVYRFGGILMRYLYSLDYFAYQSALIAYDTSSVISFLRSFLNFTLNLISYGGTVFLAQNEIGAILVRISTVSFAVISLSLSMLLKKPSVLLSGILMLVSTYALVFLLGDFWIDRRTMSGGFALLVGATLVLVYLILRNISIKKFKLKYLAIFVVILVVFYQSRDLNQIFYLDYQRYQRDLFVMHTIADDLSDLNQTKPVVFVGLIPEILPQRREVAGNSLFNHDRGQSGWHELTVARIHMFFINHNFPIVSHPNIGGIDTDGLRLRITDMPAWPVGGYIREFDEYILVRLGPSRWD